MHPLVEYIRGELQSSFSSSSATELALLLAQDITHLTSTQLILTPSDTKLTFPFDIDNMICRIKKGEPLPYITHKMEWMGLSLYVDSDVLIPRIETSELVNWVLQDHSAQTSMRVIDIGTGSGCIAIKLKKCRPQWHITAIDVSEKAIKVAMHNALVNNTDIHFCQQDVFLPFVQQLHSEYDIVVSNPPYVKENDIIDDRVRKYEPHLALFVPQDNPLVFYKRIISLHLAKQVYFETNENQTKQIAGLFKENAYDSVQVKKDLFRRDRMVFGEITH